MVRYGAHDDKRAEHIMSTLHTIDWSVCLVTDRRAAGGRDLLDIVRAAVTGGATLIQLRDKDASTREMLDLGRAMLEITRSAGVPLIVNDRIDVALALDADGVHVGQDDMPADITRNLIGPDRILGVSAETVAQAQAAEDSGADYLGVGTVFATPSKADAGAPIGLDGLRAIAQISSVPILAIGGITADNAASIREAGAHGVAVISAIVSAHDPQAAARTLRQQMQP
jgi:thiamine-phosphate pyrophosphorylase